MYPLGAYHVLALYYECRCLSAFAVNYIRTLITVRRLLEKEVQQLSDKL